MPLPIVFSRRLALERAPTRGAPTGCLLSAFGPEKGTHKGCPYRLSSLGVWPWEGHPQGVPLPDCLLSAFGPEKGTHKGCPYRIVFSRRLAMRRAPTRGAPTDCLLSAFGHEKGTHKGRPYPIQAASRDFSNLMRLPWHPNDSALGLGGFSVFGFSFLVTPLVRGSSLKLCFWVSKACQQLSGMVFAREMGILGWLSKEAIIGVAKTPGDKLVGPTSECRRGGREFRRSLVQAH